MMIIALWLRVRHGKSTEIDHVCFLNHTIVCDRRVTATVENVVSVYYGLLFLNLHKVKMAVVLLTHKGGFYFSY